MIERKTQRIINNRCPIIQLLPPNLKCFAKENVRRGILWMNTFSNKKEFALNPACLETLNEEINDFTYLSSSYLSSRLLFGLIAIVLLNLKVLCTHNIIIIASCIIGIFSDLRTYVDDGPLWGIIGLKKECWLLLADRN